MKDYIKRVIERSRGDDLYRARMAFRNLSSEKMDELYGESNKTRKQIVEEYEAHERLTDAALKWLEEVDK